MPRSLYLKTRLLLRGLFDRILAISALVVLVLGLIGFMIDNLALQTGPVDTSLFLRLLFHSFTQAVKLFWLNLSQHPESDNWLLMFARVCGAVVAATAAFRLITAVFGRDYMAFKASLYRGHAVFLGYGLRNTLFADSWRRLDPNQRQVVLDSNATRVKPLVTEPGRLFFQEDLDLPTALSPANVGRASLVLIGTGSDERNLSVCQRIIDQRAKMPKALPARIIVTLEDAALADRCMRHPGMARLEKGDELTFCNNAILAARQLLARTPFVDQALQRGQPRVRLVFAGFSDMGLEIIIQFLRLGLMETLAPSRIDIITDDPARTRARMLARIPNLRFLLEEAEAMPNAPLAWSARIFLLEANPHSLAYDSQLSDAIAAEGPVTAFILSGDHTVENISTALAIRPFTARHAALAAPIYVRTGAPEGLEKLYLRYDGIRPPPTSGGLATLSGTMCPDEVIEPFGMLEDLCTPEALFGERERLARSLHTAYRRNRLEALRRQGSTERSDLPEWEGLDETFRQANRRAVDFLPVKRMAAGLPRWWEQGGLPMDVIEDAGKLERLSRLEHASWRIDRELDGWHYGQVRDNQGMTHPDLVVYDDLSEEKKELDREQIRLLTYL